MTAIRKAWGWTTLIALLIAVSGCGGGLRSEGISSIRLVCAEGCKAMSPPPFEEKTFDGQSEEIMHIFRNVLTKAEPMRGSLEFDVTFWMDVSYKGGEVRRFALNVEDRRDRDGIIVDMENSEQEFRIPTAESKVLRSILY